MQIRFEMYVTNLIPEFLAEVAKKLERSGNVRVHASGVSPRCKEVELHGLPGDGARP